MRVCCLLSLMLATTLGCGTAEYGGQTMPKSAAMKRDVTSASPSEASVAGGEEKPQGAMPGVDALRRKIIYTATLELVVEDFEPVQSQVEALVKRSQGYVAHSAVSGMPGRPRSGQWTIRVPVDRYDGFLAAARELGEVQSVKSDSKDVSEEFYDVEARIRNKEQEEQRLLKLLAEATGKLKDVLEVEREVSRVRGEVEQLKGRLRVLSDLTALTTVELRINEVKGYVPQEAPTYGTRVRRAFEGSLTSLVSTARGFLIAMAALAPWLVVFVPAMILVIWLLRTLRRVRP